MTDEEAAAFDELKRSGVGRALRGYLERLADYACDIRHISPATPEGITAMMTAAKLLDDYVISKLRIVDEPSDSSSVNQYV